MAITKYATLEEAEVLDIKGSPNRIHLASLDKLSDYANYRVDDGYMYVRLRAISSRVNKNHDGWPSVELAGGKDVFSRYARQASGGFTVEARDGNRNWGFATFLGKPNFIDHNNANPKRARGAVVDSKLRVLPLQMLSTKGDDYWTASNADPEHLPPTEIELLIEVDAQRFPIYARHLRNGEIDGFSMGCDVEKSKCSHCGHVATNPAEYCSHIVMKGAHHDFKTADGKRISRRSYENCYGIKFFEISAVFEPADETALAREVRAAVNNEGIEKEAVLENAEGLGMQPDPLRGQMEWAVEKRALEIEQKAGVPYDQAVEMAQRELGDVGVSGEGGAYEEPKRWDYMQQGIDAQGLPEQQGVRAPRVERGPFAPQVHGLNEGFQQGAEELLQQVDPRKRPVMNDPHMSSTHTAENPLPQSMHTTAPEEIDTLRQEQSCPVCGETMDGEKCDVCGHVEPPKGMDNPDLNKAQELHQRMQQQDEAMVPGGGAGPENMGPPGGPQGPGAPPQPGAQPAQNAFGRPPQGQARNPFATASVMSDMRWSPVIDPKLAARINQIEKPIKPAGTPATNEPSSVTVTKDPKQPVTAAMRTAQQLIADANRGDTMSTKTADGPTPPGDTSADARVDVTGVGGVMDASNEQASKADAEVDVEGVGSTGVTDVSADKTESLPTASEGSDDSGFNKDKNVQDSGPTATYPDSDGTQKGLTDEVTSESLEGNQNDGKESQVKRAYDSNPFFDQPGLSGGSANKGTEPADPVGKAEDRVNVLEATTTPDNNSGATKTWSGTDGNGVEKQQPPVTTDVSEVYHDGWTSHIVGALKLADLEVDLGLTPRTEKYKRIAELQEQDDGEIKAQFQTLARVRTAGLAKLRESRRLAGAGRVPALFSQHTAAPNGQERVQLDGEQHEASAEIAEDVADSALFGR